jgi:hypothetical protein
LFKKKNAQELQDFYFAPNNNIVRVTKGVPVGEEEKCVLGRALKTWPHVGGLTCHR